MKHLYLLFALLFSLQMTFAQNDSRLTTDRLTFREGLTEKAILRFNGLDFFLDNNETSGNIFIQANADVDIEGLDDVLLHSVNDISFATGAGNGLTRMFINQDGDIGIRTTTPDEALDVNGDIAMTDGTGRIVYKEGTITKALLSYDGTDFVIRNQEFVSGVSTDIRLESENGNVNMLAGGQLNARFQSEGGLRLFAPNNSSFLLEVQNDGDLKFVRDGGVVAMGIDDVNGRIGVNTETPLRRFDVNGDVAFSGGAGTNLVFYEGTTDKAEITWSGTDLLIHNKETVVGNSDVILRSDNGRLLFRTGTSNAVRMTIDNDGVEVEERLTVTGADLAERFTVNSIDDDSKVVPGTVVAIDRENPGELTISNQAYDRAVAGIVSGAKGINTAMLLGQKGTIADGDVAVAITGRVYCKVDASYGAIQVGDLLTTSDTAGHAMKVNNYEEAQGAIIGKAMTALEEGQGMILVLISMQ
ncbi:MAG: hypothetical protein AAFP82_04540 [Bacteroidota bacterium]